MSPIGLERGIGARPSARTVSVLLGHYQIYDLHSAPPSRAVNLTNRHQIRLEAQPSE